MNHQNNSFIASVTQPPQENNNPNIFNYSQANISSQNQFSQNQPIRHDSSKLIFCSQSSGYQSKQASQNSFSGMTLNQFNNPNLFKTPPSTSKNRDRRISQLEESPIVESLSSQNDDNQSMNHHQMDLLGPNESYHKKYTKSKARDCTPQISPPEANYHLMSTAKKGAGNFFLTFGDADKTPCFQQMMSDHISKNAQNRNGQQVFSYNNENSRLLTVDAYSNIDPHQFQRDFKDESRRQLFTCEQIDDDEDFDQENEMNDNNHNKISSFIDTILDDDLKQHEYISSHNFENNDEEEMIRNLQLSTSCEIIKMFTEQFNNRQESILQLFDSNSSFEYMNTQQQMQTQEAIVIMDQEVQTLNYQEGTLSIDSQPQDGFNLFYITFEGNLNLKNEPGQKRFKISFMVEGKINYENASSGFVLNPRQNSSHSSKTVKDTHVIIKATKMNIQ
eukprot:403368547